MLWGYPPRNLTWLKNLNFSKEVHLQTVVFTCFVHCHVNFLGWRSKRKLWPRVPRQFAHWHKSPRLTSWGPWAVKLLAPPGGKHGVQRRSTNIKDRPWDFVRLKWMKLVQHGFDLNPSQSSFEEVLCFLRWLTTVDGMWVVRRHDIYSKNNTTIYIYIFAKTWVMLNII